MIIRYFVSKYVKFIKRFLLCGQIDTYGYFYRSELLKALSEDRLKKINFKKVLEIGTYEGIFTCYAAKNFAETIDTIDPFLLSDVGTRMMPTTEQNCLINLANCNEVNRIRLHKTTSDEFFKNNHNKYDFIYIDGSHQPEDAYRDLSNSYSACVDGGVIWVDDYGSTYSGLRDRIDDWINENRNSVIVIHKGYQLGMIKNKKF